MIYHGEGMPKNKSKAFLMWDKLIDDCLSQKVDFKHFLPAFLIRWYYSGVDLIESLIS